MSTRLIQDLHAGISRRDWSAVETAANALRDESEKVRRALAATDFGSLPNDYPTLRMVEDRMEQLSRRYASPETKAEDLSPEETAIATCEACGKHIQEGEPYLWGPETDFCGECAPTYQALINEPEGFVSADGDPLTPEQCRAWFDEHIAAGGKATDSMATVDRTPVTPPQEHMRPCTCHPDDSPPVPCAERYALTDCKAASLVDRLRGVSALQKPDSHDGFDVSIALETVEVLKGLCAEAADAIEGTPPQEHLRGQFLPTEDGEFNGNVGELIVPPHCSGYSFVFEPGVLHVKKDGSGYIVVNEEDFTLEDDRDEEGGSVHWISRMDASEITALRNFLNGVPQEHLRVTDEMVEAACAAHWVEPWPGDRSQPALKSARTNMRAALEAALTTEGQDNGR